MSNQDQTNDVLMYPPDGGLTEQVRHYDDTFSAWTAVKEHFSKINLDTQ